MAEMSTAATLRDAAEANATIASMFPAEASSVLREVLAGREAVQQLIYLDVTTLHGLNRAVRANREIARVAYGRPHLTPEANERIASDLRTTLTAALDRATGSMYPTSPTRLIADDLAEEWRAALRDIEGVCGIGAERPPMDEWDTSVLERALRDLAEATERVRAVDQNHLAALRATLAQKRSDPIVARHLHDWTLPEQPPDELDKIEANRAHAAVDSQTHRP